MQLFIFRAVVVCRAVISYFSFWTFKSPAAAAPWWQMPALLLRADFTGQVQSCEQVFGPHAFLHLRGGKKSCLSTNRLTDVSDFVSHVSSDHGLCSLTVRYLLSKLLDRFNPVRNELILSDIKMCLIWNVWQIWRKRANTFSQHWMLMTYW